MQLVARRSQAALSGERAALAASIVELAEAEARKVAIAGAEDRLWNVQRDAQTEANAATLALAEAQRAAVTALHDGAPAAPSSIRGARARLTDATDALEAARQARTELNARAADAEHDIESARRRRHNASLEVVRAEAFPSGMALVAEMLRQQRELARHAEALRWLLRAEVFSVGTVPGPAYGVLADKVVYLVAGRVPVMAGWAEPGDERGDAVWQGWLDRLVLDASAALPT